MGAPEMCIIFNPSAGRGRALRRLRSLRRTLGSRAAFWPTQGPGHAVELARQAALAGFPVVGGAGGDGTIHEVTNGLLQSGRAATTLAVFPIGSANDYAWSLGLQPEWWRRPPVGMGPRKVDVGLVQAPDGRQRYFINGLGLGFNCAVTAEARRTRWLQGIALYGVGVLRALCWRYACPKMMIHLDDDFRQGPTLMLTLAIGPREGNFLLAPRARLDDGLFDYLQVGPLPRWRLLRYLPNIITGNLPTHEPHVWMGQCRQMSLVSEVPLTVHTDGEFFCEPPDRIGALEVRLLPGALNVLGPPAR